MFHYLQVLRNEMFNQVARSLTPQPWTGTREAFTPVIRDVLWNECLSPIRENVK
jgi:hypothetical protein